MVKQKHIQSTAVEQIVIELHTAEKLKKLMDQKPKNAEKVAVHRFKLGLIFYREHNHRIEAYFTDTSNSWVEARNQSYADLETALNTASFILCDVGLLEKELSLHGYSDQPIPVLDRVFGELGVLHESAVLRREDSVQNSDYWHGYQAAIESARMIIRQLNT